MTTTPLPPAHRIGAVIVAAGASTRMQGADKTLADLGGEPLIARAVDTFEQCAAVGAIALVAAERNLDAIAALRSAKGWRKTMPPLPGGARRQDSVRIGLAALPPECEWALVHDGARPFVTSLMIEDGLRAAADTGAAIAVVPAFDTVKRVAADGRVIETLDRSELAMTQTPQVFRRAILERAHAEVTDDVTDDAAMVERMRVEVRTFDGARSNIKVTTPEDMEVAGALLGESKMAVSPASLDDYEEQAAAATNRNHPRDLEVVEAALEQIKGGLDALPTTWSQDDRLYTARFLLVGRCLNSLKASLVLLRRGYYQQPLALVRMVWEDNLTALDAANHKETLSALIEGIPPLGKGDLTFSAMAKRQSLDEEWKGNYGPLSEYAAHTRYQSLHVPVGQTPEGNEVGLGAYYDEQLTLTVIREVLRASILTLNLMGELTTSAGVEGQGRGLATTNAVAQLIERIDRRTGVDEGHGG